MIDGLPYKKMIFQGSEKSAKSLFTIHFTDLPKPLRTSKINFKYPLEEILFLTISSVISGWFEDWENIIFFGESRLDWLRKLYPF